MYILNKDTAPKEGAQDTIARALKQEMNQLKGSFFDLETGQINYDAMRESEAFAAFNQAAAGLKQYDLSQLGTHQEKLAFWLNLYNVLVIHGIIQLKITKSVRDFRGFFEKVGYQIGDEVFTMDTIEHGILRRNKKKHLFARRPLKNNDSRLRWMMETLEPRIHFCLVCGSKSCPPIGTYQEAQLETQLNLATGNFINSDNLRVDLEKKTLEISKIFDWYGKDFGSKQELLQFIAQYRRDETEAEFIKNYKGSLNYLPYDWNLNA